MDISEGVGATLLGGVVVKVVEAVAKIIGSRKERSEADRDAADVALRIAEEEREETRRTRRERDSCEERLAAMEVRMRAVEATQVEHQLCGPRIAELERETAYLRSEQTVARRMLHDLMRHASTPPSGLYTGDDVRAAMAAEEAP